ncbi:M20/M25/M40 family metallo-hydrolase [Geodermatophilus sp. SYSU D01186]
MHPSLRRRCAAPVLLALVSPALVASPAGAADGPDTSALRDAVTVEGVAEHLEAFQQIAKDNDGTRASGTPGFDASGDYVADRLLDAGYRVTEQEFAFPYFEQTAPATFVRTAPTERAYTAEDFAVAQYSGSGTASAPVQAVTDNLVPPPPEPNSSTAGCQAEDYAGFVPGNIALVQRGTCTFGEKATVAAAAGASALIIFNEGQQGRTEVLQGTLGGPLPAEAAIPVVGTSYAVGEELTTLLGAGEVRADITTSTVSEQRTTSNYLADTRTGRTDEVVVVGAHLDSVTAGPGINDNGTGSATVLEIAEQFAELGIEPRNAVRFAFWGAEESGLLGSTHYVAGLTEQQRADIALNLNFDMLGSPNFARFVYDGDASDTPTAGPAGSADIERVFLDHFASVGLATAPSAFNGRSDYGPFIAQGIPAGGLFSGAEGVKTEEQVALFGGTAGVAYDACYHQACDDIANVNLEALGQLGDGAAHAALWFAQAETLPGAPPAADPGAGGAAGGGSSGHPDR